MDIKEFVKFIEKNKQKKITVRLNKLRKFPDTKKKGKKQEKKKKKQAKKQKNPIAFTVITALKGGMCHSITTLYPGFFTRGHKHKNPYPELYILAEGAAKLIIKDKNKKTINLKKGKVYFVPGKSWHRTINTGKTNAKIVSIYSAKAGHIY